MLAGNNVLNVKSKQRILGLLNMAVFAKIARTTSHELAKCRVQWNIQLEGLPANTARAWA